MGQSSGMTKRPPLAVTGMGLIAAGATNLHEMWSVLTAEPEPLSPPDILHDDAMPFPFFRVPDAAFGPQGRRRTAADTLHLAVNASRQALKNSGFVPGASGNLGVIVGTTSGSALHFLDGYKASREGKKATATDIDDYFHSNVALELGNLFKAEGPLLTLSNACTSGADAVGMAMDLLHQGICDAVLCGGADTLSIVPHTGFARLMISSDSPCRPFDAQRTGLNLGEGAGMLLLETKESAEKRGAAIMGWVAGYGSAADAYHFTAPHPKARGLAQAVDNAIEDAGIDKSQIAFINAHGTATKENDKVEGTFFQKNFPKTPVWASKAVTGHTLGAAGALEAIFCLLAFIHGEVPQSRNFHSADPCIGLEPTKKALSLSGGYALSTSLGFGGGNSCLILAG